MNMAKNLLELKNEMEVLASTFYKETGVTIQVVYFTWENVPRMDVAKDQAIQKIEFTMT